MASIIKVDQIQESTTGVGTNFSTTGSATTPTISIGNQTNKGFYHSATDTIGISIGGSKVGQIDSNGITITQPYWNIVDQKASGTNGGTFTSGAWRTRDLNTTRGTNSISGSSLSSNQFTLPSGTYRIFSRCQGSEVNYHKAKLRNITDSSDVLIGSSNFNLINYGNISDSIINGIFTITSQKTFELQHYCTSTYANTGFGNAISISGIAEIYASVELWKLA